jgi:hypothetical protein
MPKPKPPCQDLYAWLRANLANTNGVTLGALTSTDARALEAAVHILEAYAYDRHPDVILAFGAIVKRMQPRCQEFAYHTIAKVMNWEDRAPLWLLAELPPLEHIRRCKFE